MNKGSDRAFMHTDVNNTIEWGANGIGGIFETSDSDGNSAKFDDDFKPLSFYDLSKLPQDRFRLKRLETPPVYMDEMLETFRKYSEVSQTYKCDLSADEYKIASTLTRITRMYIPDRYIKIIGKFGECNVNTAGQTLVVSKNTYDEKMNVNVDNQIYFRCEDFASHDENIQGKMQFDMEDKLA
ncbi:MAG: hypothetical protein RR531_12145 [Longicatena sp.]